MPFNLFPQYLLLRGRTALNGGQTWIRTGYEARSDVFMSKHTIASAMGFLTIHMHFSF